MRETEWIKTVAAAVAVSLLKRSNFMSFNLVYYFSCGGGGFMAGLACFPDLDRYPVYCGAVEGS